MPPRVCDNPKEKTLIGMRAFGTPGGVKLAKILIIGCGGVASVAIQKCAKKADVFSRH